MADGSSRSPANAIPVFTGVLSPTPPTPPPNTIAGGGNWNSGVIVNPGAKSVAVSAELTQAGTLSVQRYVDASGVVPIGNAISQTLSASVVGTVVVNDGIPWASMTVVVANTSGSVGTLSNVNVLVQ